MEGVLILKSASSLNCSSQDLSPPLPPDAQEDKDLQASSAVPRPMCVNAAPPPLPPPPPPPPPPLPPPPPPLLTASPFGSRNVQRKSMKKLNWDTIPSQRVLGKLNVWTSKRPQRDLVLDIRSMEELFSHVDKRASLHRPKAMGLMKCDDLFPQDPQVTILDSKKSMNIGIFLRQFKRPVTEMVEDIRHGNWLRFGTGKLKEFCKLLPEESEVKQLLSFRGNLSVLPEADQFMVQLVKVPGYEERLKMMVLRDEFFPLMEEVKNSVAVMTKAANELLDCDDLHSVIRLVLKAGNYMNAGGYSANVIGFRMTSLLKLADTKANKPGMNLMHYVAKQVEDIDAELLTFPSQLEHIGMASRICKEDVIADFEREVKKINEVKLYSSRQPDLLQQMETFLMRAEAKLADVESYLQGLNSLSNAVAEYFCEDPATFKLEECCSIFHSFCKRFDTAVQENRGREEAEQRRKRKESMRIAAKRRSTVSGPGPEPDRDSSSLEVALHSFLSTVPEGLARCRRHMLPPVEGSPADRSPQTVSSAEKASPCTGQERPEKKQPKLQKQDDQVAALENREEAEKMREITRKVLRYQNSRSSLDGDRVSGTPRRSKRAQETPATPSTPQPRTRDFFFANNGDMGSPWTILSPFTCSKRNLLQRNRQARKERLSSTSGGDDLDDGVWDSDEGSCLPNFANCDSLKSPSGGSASLPECPHQKAERVSQGPILRSVSMDETRQSPVSGFRLGDLFQRSYSSGSRTENMGEEVTGGFPLHHSKARNHVDGQVRSSGFISFFRRIRGRSKPGDVEEQNFKGSNT
ncbi:FH2 domain containing 3 [Toxotes jaculatrix]|uniref:FH2 domain containing 3 n=1 Tax=Toxotes jaculatrix TaxID=941984 RepID=UPI001B3B146D|nr:FH2 domain containing 3 [Toxotes jaculatrix]